MVITFRGLRKVSGKAIWLKWTTLDELEHFRQGSESIDDTVSRILRRVKELQARRKDLR